MKSFLTEKASRGVKGLAITTENYEEALQVLDERFDNVQIIVSSHFEELTKLPVVYNNDDTAKLRELYDKIETNLRSLRATGIQADTYGCILVPMLKNKLPKEINLLLSRKFDPKKGLWEIEETMRELRIELEARERCMAKKEVKRDKVHRPAYSTTEALMAVEGLKCPYCQASHFPDKCDVVTNIETTKALLKSQRRCFNCTKKGHNLKNCRSKKTCFKCKEKHHTSICYQSRRSEIKDNEKESSENSKIDGKNKKTSSMLANAIKNREIILKAAVVSLKNSSTQKWIEAKMILDTGSQRSYISQKVQCHLNLKIIRTEEISIDDFGEQATELKQYDLVAFNISTKSTTDKVKVRALDVKRLCNRSKGHNINLDPLKYPKLHQLEFINDCEHDNDIEVGVLIRLDHYWDIVIGNPIRDTQNLVALETKLGYILFGPVHTKIHRNNSVATFFANVAFNQEESTKQELDKFWSLESLGIIDKETVEERFLPHVSKKDGRYEVKLHWKDQHPLLYDNFILAKKRLESLLKRLRQNSALLKQYSDIINEQLKNNIVEEVNDNLTTIGKTYYMPHQAVIREDHTTSKLRVVYDAFSKLKGPTLNDCLEAGESRYTDLFGTSIRLRLHNIAVVTDIEKAFLNIGIQEDDRDALRFLWKEDPFDTRSKLKILRFTRVCFGLVSNMFHLEATIEHHLNRWLEDHPDINRDIINKIKHSLYVDDLSSGAEKLKDASEFYIQSRLILEKANMNLRKWKSNSNELMIFIKEHKQEKRLKVLEEQSYADLSLNPGLVDDTKVLSIPWYTSRDTFNSFTIQHLLHDIRPEHITKRKFLQFSASAFNPLGILSPAMLPLKVMFQQLCKEGRDWDEELPAELSAKFQQWISKAIKVHRDREMLHREQID